MHSPVNILHVVLSMSFSYCVVLAVLISDCVLFVINVRMVSLRKDGWYAIPLSLDHSRQYLPVTATIMTSNDQQSTLDTSFNQGTSFYVSHCWSRPTWYITWSIRSSSVGWSQHHVPLPRSLTTLRVDRTKKQLVLIDSTLIDLQMKINGLGFCSLWRWDEIELSSLAVLELFNFGILGILTPFFSRLQSFS